MIADLHVHTQASPCSTMTPEQLEKAALKAGLDAVVVTDHNTHEGYFSARESCTKVRIYPGVEVTCREGEIIGLFIEAEVEKGQSIVDAAKEITKAGGLVVAPHPFDLLRKGVGSDIGLIKPHAVEVFNSRCLLPLFNSRAEQYAEVKRILPVCGSDAHFPSEVGRSAVRCRGDLEQALRKGKVEVFRTRYSLPTVHLMTAFAKLL